MRTVILNIPDNVDKNDSELLMVLASKLYEDNILSAGQAAEVAGLSKRAFIELLGKYGVSLFPADSEALQADIDNA